MAKATRLSLVQGALAIIDSESVSTVGESVESVQVGEILDIVYDRILRTYPWPSLFSEFALETTSTAHIMRIPATAWQIDWIKYDKKDVTYITPKEMRDLLDERDTTLTEVDANGAYNERDPKYWTTIDDEEIIFDAYNVSLAANKSKCSGIIAPAKLTLDTSVPVLPERFHSVILDGLAAELSMIFKDNAALYNIYSKKYKNGIIQMKRWARIVNEQNSTHEGTYARPRI